MESGDEQQFCLRWNNFQANITSQFETLRDDEDFTDVTIACEGQRLQAHKVVLSACSPYFKELFKTNPCSHPIIFMRDVEARHVVALMEFMYAGEVNVAQAHLSAFLRTAESLKIRGLTDTNPDFNQRDEDALFLNPQPSSSKAKEQVNVKNNNNVRKSQNTVACSSAVTSSQDDGEQKGPSSPPPPKRQCKQEPEVQPSQLENTALQRLRQIDESISINPFALNDNQETDVDTKKPVQPKIELPDYLSDDDGANYFPSTNDLAALTGGMEIIPQNITTNKDSTLDHSIGRMLLESRRRSESWSPFELRNQTTSPDLISRLRDSTRENDDDRTNRLVKLGEGIEIHEDQLRSVKWSDYRKLTRGLATILFSPAELATCSVTGQRWSRAGSGERPVKPALDRAKVQAIISYVATRFPMVEISRIKQVLAYKCKENSTAFKMKAVRYYGDHIREPDRN